MEHLSGYQARDHNIVDYQMSLLEETGLWFRGPLPDLSAPYFSCLGAAQTFGCFCQTPFPTQLQARLSLPALNLGYGGAGPEFYLRHPQLIDIVNQGEFAIVQIMSGRSVSNARFESGGLEYLTRRADGRKLGAEAAYKSILDVDYRWQQFPQGLQRYARKGFRLWGATQLKPLVADTRQRWIENYQTLLARITVPKILFWFSQRSPNYVERYNDIQSVFGAFPQLVNRDMVEAVRLGCHEYVECVSQRGLPQPLFDRHTGEPTTVTPANDRADLGSEHWTHNHYYPSPEMHDDATVALLASPLLRSRHLATQP